MNPDDLQALNDLLEQIRSMKVHASSRLGAALKKPLLLLLLVSRIENDRVEENRFHFDDIEKKLGLCKLHHWAFDKGILGIDEGACICIADAFVAQHDGGLPLESLVNRSFAVQPCNKAIAKRFLDCHRNNVYLGAAK
ncbi:MAG: hypothetical protein ACLP9L_12960 [Thermoguttaceae bacterium]